MSVYRAERRGFYIMWIMVKVLCSSRVRWPVHKQRLVTVCETYIRPQRTGVARSWRTRYMYVRKVAAGCGNASRARAAFPCNEPTGRLVELIKAHRMTSSDFSEASPAGFYSRSPAAHHWSPRRCGVPPNLTESSSQSRVQTTPSVNKWSAASRRSALE